MKQMICLDCETVFERDAGPHLFTACPKCGCTSITTLEAYNYNPNTTNSNDSNEVTTV